MKASIIAQNKDITKIQYAERDKQLNNEYFIVGSANRTFFVMLMTWFILSRKISGIHIHWIHLYIHKNITYYLYVNRSHYLNDY